MCRPQRPLGQRTFHHIPILVLTTMTVAYYAMASNLGRTGVQVEFAHSGRAGLRDIFWVRWIMWFICAPLLILMLLLTTGVALSDVFLTIFMSWVWIVCYLVGALVVTRFKWGFYAIGTVALLYVM
jgi:bacteriorhodopsin